MTAPTLRDSPDGEPHGRIHRSAPTKDGVGGWLRRLIGRGTAVKVAKQNGKQISPEAAQIMRVVAEHNQHLWPRMDTAMQQADEYQRSSWVYVAVTRIAEAAALVPMEVYAA